MTTTRKCMKERIEEFKKGFTGEQMDPDTLMFREEANKIKHDKELEATPTPPDTETIIKEIHQRRGIRS